MPTGGKSTRQRPAEERFWEKVDVTGDCWEWTATATGRGYGTFAITRSLRVKAYRYVWELLVGPIPPGMTIDHLCNNPKCVNPDHLRVVSPRENMLAGHCPAAMNARKTHCKRGHPLNGDNIVIRNGQRRCVTCKTAQQDARNEQRRKARVDAAIDAQTAEWRQGRKASAA